MNSDREAIDKGTDVGAEVCVSTTHDAAREARRIMPIKRGEHCDKKQEDWR